MKTGTIKIFYRSIIYLGFFLGPKVHPILKDWNNNYHELDKTKGKIKIYTGKTSNLGKFSKIFFKTPRKPKESIKVDKDKFLKAVKEFKKINEGKTYRLLNFKTNCIGFKNYVINKSKIKAN